MDTRDEWSVETVLDARSRPLDLRRASRNLGTAFFHPADLTRERRNATDDRYRDENVSSRTREITNASGPGVITSRWKFVIAFAERSDRSVRFARTVFENCDNRRERNRNLSRLRKFESNDRSSHSFPRSLEDDRYASLTRLISLALSPISI